MLDAGGHGLYPAGRAVERFKDLAVFADRLFCGRPAYDQIANRPCQIVQPVYRDADDRAFRFSLCRGHFDRFSRCGVRGGFRFGESGRLVTEHVVKTGVQLRKPLLSLRVRMAWFCQGP